MTKGLGRQLPGGGIDTRLTHSSKSCPCPICGRDSDSDCRVGQGIVLCHYGSSFSPPPLKPGETTQGSDGQTWAFTGRSEDHRCAVFKVDEPLSHQLLNGYSSRGYIIRLNCTKFVPIAQKTRDELKTHPLNPLQSVISNWQQRPPRPLLIKP